MQYALYKKIMLFFIRVMTGDLQRAKEYSSSAMFGQGVIVGSK